MPVGTAFNLQFRAGDAIYGISQSRAAYINSLPVGTANHLRSVGQYVICDEFNNRTFGQIPVVDFGIGQQPGTKAAIKTNLQNHEGAGHLSILQKAALEEYYDALKGTKYAPLDAVKMKIAAVTAKGNQNHEDLVFRRACKFGLQYIMDVKGHTVHFVLDVPAYMGVAGNRINSLDVATKGQHGGHVPITTSELRRCYRNRANWTAGANPPLKFYFNLIEVNPPWIDDPAEWAVYEAHRVQKGMA